MNVGIIVDGSGDYAALRARFKNGYRIVKTDGPRGHTARASDIVSKARKQISLLGGLGCHQVVVLLDFERRSEAWERFAANLKQEFDGSFRGQWSPSLYLTK